MKLKRDQSLAGIVVVKNECLYVIQELEQCLAQGGGNGGLRAVGQLLQ